MFLSFDKLNKIKALENFLLNYRLLTILALISLIITISIDKKTLSSLLFFETSRNLIISRRNNAFKTILKRFK